MVLFNIIYILVALYISFNRPTLFLCAYILFYTQYLGFVPNNIILSGVDYGTFFFNIIIILPLIIKGKIQRTFDQASKYAILFVTLFILYGVLKPYLDGTQSILMGVKASKSFLTYTILIYLMLYRKHINFNIIFYFIRLIAFYFSLLYLINTVGIRIIPPCYVKYDYLQCQYDSFIAFAIIILYYQQLNGTFVRFFALKVTLLMIGLLLGGYFSLFTTSLFLLLVFHIRKYCINLIDYFITIVFIGLLFITFLQVVISTDWFHQIEIKQTNALLTREKYNEFRWDIIHKNLWFGCGFLYKSSEIVKSLSSSGYSETFSFIDAGYVDLLGRFGWIMMLVFLLYPLKYFFSSIKDKALFPFAMLIFQFFCVNYTWAVFSFPMGIILLSLTYTFISTIYDGKKTTELADFQQN